tara:strand:- start:17141 stop:18037 length:897 start_codon:yes stop_codon:yes gene_type:complete
MAIPEGYSARVKSVNPTENMTKEDYVKYTKECSEVTIDTLNKNTCNKQREVKNPYQTYKLVRNHDLYGKNAEFRVLRFYQAPKSLKFFSMENDARILTAVKSDATFGSWEVGDMYFRDLAHLLMEGFIEETQRTIEYSLYEWRMAIYHASLSEDREEINVLNEYKLDIAKTLHAIIEGNLSWKEVKEQFDGQIEATSKGFNYQSSDKVINSKLNLLSESFGHAEDREVKMLLSFINNVIARYKVKHIEMIEERGETPTPSLLNELSNPIDIALAIEEELEVIKVALKSASADITIAEA